MVRGHALRQSAVLPAGRRQGTESGFTLLELMLVVFILSALALTASAFVDNHDDQFRFEDTRRRVPSIDRAKTILGFVPKVKLEEGLMRSIAWCGEDYTR